MNAMPLLPVLETELATLVSSRPGETRVGEVIPRLGRDRRWDEARRRGARFALLGIPEDVGPRANLGRAGAEGAWEAFLASFLNQQANEFLPVERVVLAGRVQVQDLQDASQQLGSSPAHVRRLRELCAEIDGRVAPVLREVVAAGLVPIVIGGGHNNAFPILQGTVQGLRERGVPLPSGLAVVNCDPHADFRLLEGRHSGNGFSYAREAGLMASYFVLGLHEGYNSQEMLQRLRSSGGSFVTFESFRIRGPRGFEEALQAGWESARDAGTPVGLELDLDAVAHMPSSAEAPDGLTLEQAARFVHAMASRLPVAYLHLPEGAPACHAQGGVRHVGKALAFLVSTFLKAAPASG